MSQRRLLPSHPRAVSLARSHVAEDCHDLPRRTVEAALLLTSELVGNAVRHGSPDVVMTVDCDEELLHVAVEDTATALPAPCALSLTAEGGRGLMLVQAYADRWGVRRLAHGKAVWFSLSCPGVTH